MALTVGGGAQGLANAYARMVEPVLDQQAAVPHLSFNVDGMDFEVEGAEVALAAPVLGNRMEAVIAGSGRAAVPLPDDNERQQTELFTGSRALHLEFSAAIFHFAGGEDFFGALGTQARWRPGAPDGLRTLAAEEGRSLRSTASSIPVRLLNDLAAGGSRTGLYVSVRTKIGRWVQLDFDPTRAQPLRVHAVSVMPEPLLASNSRGPRATEPVRFDDTWTQFAPRGWNETAPAFEVRGYELRVGNPRGGAVELGESLDLRLGPASRSGLMFRLDAKYRVQSVTAAGLAAPEWLQSPDPAQAEAGSISGNWLYVQWPRAIAGGSEISLALRLVNPTELGETQGRSRQLWLPGQAWYPVEFFGGFNPGTAFDIQAFEPNAMHLLVSARVGPLGGWLLGPAETLTRESLPGGGTLAFRTLPTGRFRDLDVLREQVLASYLYFSREFGNLPRSELGLKVQLVAPPLDPASGARLLRAPAVYSNMEAFRGGTPGYARIPGRDGPSWPGLVIGDPRWAIEGSIKKSSPMEAMTMAHVIAHQWWGNWVSAAGPQDAWLIEGLASGSTNLFEAESAGNAAAAATRGRWMAEMDSHDAFGRIPNELGPLVLGPRLNSSLDPQGFDVLALDKGGYVVEMLAAMMGQAAFQAAMREVVTRFGGRRLTTADFERIVAAHAPSSLDLDGSHTLRWFFRQYVESGGATPRVGIRAQARETGGGVRLVVEVSNPDQWWGLIPVDAVGADGQVQRLIVPVRGTATEWEASLPFRPARIAADPEQQMLVRIDSSSRPRVF